MENRGKRDPVVGCEVALEVAENLVHRFQWLSTQGLDISDPLERTQLGVRSHYLYLTDLQFSHISGKLCVLSL